MDKNEFEQFWDWLLGKASDDDAYWLDTWLDDHLDEWNELPVCKCGHRAQIDETIWSKTGNWVLERITKCANCNKIIKRVDSRQEIIKAIKGGHVKVKDLKILKKEVK